MEKGEIPIGFGMALAMNPEAMKKFSDLPEARQKAIIDGTHNVNSKSEMQQYEIGEKYFSGIKTKNPDSK